MTPLLILRCLIIKNKANIKLKNESKLAVKLSIDLVNSCPIRYLNYSSFYCNKPKFDTTKRAKDK
jgi:hypothetical protein